MGKKIPSLVSGEQGGITPIGHFSFTINAISDRLENGVFLCIDKIIAEDERVVNLIEHLQALPQQLCDVR